MDLYEKHGIPREIDGIKIKIQVLKPWQYVVAGRLVRQGPANCQHPGCFRVRPVGSDRCPPHEGARP